MPGIGVCSGARSGGNMGSTIESRSAGMEKTHAPRSCRLKSSASAAARRQAGDGRTVGWGRRWDGAAASAPRWGGCASGEGGGKPTRRWR
eukprot:2439046-Prymnesium_polylepis.1